MKNSLNILIVDNNYDKNTEKQKAIKESGISNEVKVAMNAGHALLYLDHIHLNKKIFDTHLVIILNMETPISNGYEFLSTYQNSSNFKKERIHIIVISENLCDDKKEKIKKLGVSNFIPDSFPVNIFREIIESQFKSNSTARKGQKMPNENAPPHAAARS